MSEFTHFDREGNASMVDVTEKGDTVREALACGRISMSRECYEKVKAGEVGKGDVLGVARIAGIMGAKKTSDLIPLCHGLRLTKVELDFAFLEDQTAIQACCLAKTVGKTGVEMEALTGVQIALLTIYDMCKAIDKGMRMDEIRLLRKSGGKSGNWEAQSGSRETKGENRETQSENREIEAGSRETKSEDGEMKHER